MANLFILVTIGHTKDDMRTWPVEDEYGVNSTRNAEASHGHNRYVIAITEAFDMAGVR